MLFVMIGRDGPRDLFREDDLAVITPQFSTEELIKSSKGSLLGSLFRYMGAPLGEPFLGRTFPFHFVEDIKEYIFLKTIAYLFFRKP